MSFDKLQPELWSHILEYLTPTLPKPLSGLTKEEAIGESPETVARLPHAGAPGTTSRSDIRADALAKLMRCSIAFNQLASSPLYRTVITDDLQSFTESNTEPTHPLIKSKDELLKQVRALHLEYRQKGVEHTYTQILGDSRYWHSLGARSSLELAYIQADGESCNLGMRLLELSIQCDGPPFPHLHTLTVGTIFGGQEGLWQRAAKRVAEAQRRDSEFGDFISGASSGMINVFSPSPILHFCQRGQAGPLSLPVTFTWGKLGSSSRTTPTFTMHFDTKQRYIPAALGYQSRWLLEQYEYHGDILAIIQFMIAAATKVEKHRINFHEDLHDSPGFGQGITMYGSGDRAYPPDSTDVAQVREATVEKQRDVIGWALKTLKEDLGQVRAEQAGAVEVWDELVWKCSPDSPICEACHWAFERGT